MCSTRDLVWVSLGDRCLGSRQEFRTKYSVCSCKQKSKNWLGEFPLYAILFRNTSPSRILSSFRIWSGNISDLYCACRLFDSLRNKLTVYSRNFQWQLTPPFSYNLSKQRFWGDHIIIINNNIDTQTCLLGTTWCGTKQTQTQSACLNAKNVHLGRSWIHGTPNIGGPNLTLEELKTSFGTAK